MKSQYIQSSKFFGFLFAHNNFKKINMKYTYKNKISISLLATILSAPINICANELDTLSIESAAGVEKNVMFLLDKSASMKEVLNDGSGLTRLQALRAAFTKTMQNVPDNTNIGLARIRGLPMQYKYGLPSTDTTSKNFAKGMVFPISPATQDSHALLGSVASYDNLPDPAPGTPVSDFLAQIVNSYGNGGGTPTIDQLYETILYFQGKDSMYGIYPYSDQRSAHPLSLDGETAYKSPITNSCQANYLVLMADDPPRSRITATTEIRTLLGEDCATQPIFTKGTCGPELTKHLATQDQAPWLAGEQTVKTFVVSFNVSDPDAINYLKSLATVENGFFDTHTVDQLSNAFDEALKPVSVNKSASFTSPTYAVDSKKPMGHSADIYMPIFSPNNTPLWSGNIRKFKLVNGKIVDKNGKAAINEAGELVEGSHDYWSIAAAGANVQEGGAASQLPAPQNRKLYTDAGGYWGTLSTANSSITNSMLRSLYTTEHGLVDAVNTSDRDGFACEGWYYDCNGQKHSLTTGVCVNIDKVTTCQSPPVSETYRESLLTFARGSNQDGTPRKFIGDIINSQPRLLEYGNDSQLIFGSNEGFIHALDAKTGIEQWAFMPEMLLKNIDNFYRNEENKKHIYGVDGKFTIWKQDTDNDGVNDKTYLFFGLRRGGSAYYALDLSNKDRPKLLWRITEKTRGFASLGETWSTPTLSKMRFGSGINDIKDVLIFGGGYDARKDIEDPNLREADQLGTDIYIVDAATGQLLWSLKDGDQINGGGAVLNANNIKHSIPGDIRVLDMDNNGTLDRLYFADTGGNVWRVDMDMDIKDDSPSLFNYSRARLTHFADLGTGNDSGGNRVYASDLSMQPKNNDDYRKFFYEPDTALMSYKGKPILTIALGSGYRTQPLNENTDDRFYVLRDPYVYDPAPENFQPLTNKELVDVETLTKPFLAVGAQGWFYDLPEPHEKVLAPAITFMNKVVFTTYAKESEGIEGNEQCGAMQNPARAYVLDFLTGKAVADLRRDGGANDRSVIIGFNKLLDSPQIIFNQPSSSNGGACKLGNCQQTFTMRIGTSQLPIVDLNNTNGSSYGNSVNLDMMPQLYWLDSDATIDGYQAP